MLEEYLSMPVVNTEPDGDDDVARADHVYGDVPGGHEATQVHQAERDAAHGHCLQIPATLIRSSRVRGAKQLVVVKMVMMSGPMVLSIL